MLLFVRLIDWIKSNPKLLPVIKTIIREDTAFVAGLMIFVMVIEFLR